MPSRINVIRETRIYPPGGWQLCFHWCSYVYDNGDPVDWGYRFIWRRAEDASLQAARGQARIPSFLEARQLMEAAEAEGWGDRNGDMIGAAAERLELAGFVVDRAAGYVGFSGPAGSTAANPTLQQLEDAALLQRWS